jgi:hypothetical protein
MIGILDPTDALKLGYLIVSILVMTEAALRALRRRLIN